MKNLRVKAEIRPMWGFYRYDDFTTHVLCLALVPYLTFRFIWTKKGADWMNKDFVKEWFDKQPDIKTAIKIVNRSQDFCHKKADGYCACNKECGDFELTK